MNVKDTASVDRGLSITLMLAKVALAKNAENRELLEKPIRHEDRPEPKSVDATQKQKHDGSPDGNAGAQPVGDNAKLVDVTV